MEDKKIPCANCKMRGKYDKNPKSLIARLWHWHTSFCPGWKAYFGSLTQQEQALMKQKYNLK